MTNMTYAQALEIAIASVADEAVVEKLTALKAQMAKKHSSSKPTKLQIENEKIKDEILEVLATAEERLRVGDVLKLLEGEYTSQKISRLMSQLVEAGKVTKEIEKKVSYFSLAQ